MANLRILDGAIIDYTNDGWAVFRHWLDGTHASLLYAWVDTGSAYEIAASDGKFYRTCSINKDNGAAQTDFETYFKKDKPASSTSNGILRVSAEQPLGTRIIIRTHNWDDKLTWYQQSVYVEDFSLTDSGDGLTWNTNNTHLNWIDSYHYRMWQEWALLDSQSRSLRVTVKVNGTTKTEKNPHTNVGDYVVNYTNGTVTFDSSQAGNTVTATFHKCNTAAGASKFVISPDTGKYFNFVQARVYAPDNMKLPDTITYQVQGYVDVFAPQLTPDPFPSGTLIPLQTVVYNTMDDLISDANVIETMVKSVATDLTSRDLPATKKIMIWNYAGISNLYNQYGMRVEVSLDHDIPATGSGKIYAVFEGRVYDET